MKILHVQIKQISSRSKMVDRWLSEFPLMANQSFTILIKISLMQTVYPKMVFILYKSICNWWFAFYLQLFAVDQPFHPRQNMAQK